MKSLILKSSMLLLCSLMLIFTSCKDETNDVVTDETQTIEDVAKAEVVVEDMENEIALRSSEYVTDSGYRNECPVVTFEKPRNQFPNKITIDFGTDGCVGRGGRVRKGKIVVTITGPMHQAGSVWTATTEDFYVDDAKVVGLKVHTNNGNHSFTHSANVNITFGDGTSMSFESTETRTQVGGLTTPQRMDDSFSITGSRKGTNRKGETFSANITKALLKSRECRWITEGTVQHTRADKSWTLDFGDGTCDNQATVTNSNGETKTITLRR